MQTRLLVVSGPSGAGKSTLVKRYLETEPRSTLSVSCTTRERRVGEIDGVHYHFVSTDEFQQRRDSDEFAEYATVHGHWYGTLKSEIERGMDADRVVLFDIDYQGAQQLLEAYPDATTVMVLPPNLEVLEQRLRRRATDSDEVIARRMAKARHEIHQADRFDFLIVNDDLDAAFAALQLVTQSSQFVARRLWPHLMDSY